MFMFILWVIPFMTGSPFFIVRLCLFCVVIRLFHTRHNGKWPPTSKDFSISDLIHYLYFPILILEKEPVFPLLMFSAKQGNYWYHFWYDAVLDWGLNPRPPALEASTISLGYRGRGHWLGIEPKTSRTRSQHSTTRLSSRRCSHISNSK